MGQLIGNLILSFIGLFILGFIVTPIVGFLFTSTLMFGPEAVWDAACWLWNIHWTLPFLTVFAIPALGIATVFGK